MLRQKYQLKNYNWILVLAVSAISILGVVFINSADSTYTARQLGGLLCCSALMFLLSVVNYNFICDYSQISRFHDVSQKDFVHGVIIIIIIGP